jgi:hypothetical protein
MYRNSLFKPFKIIYMTQFLNLILQMINAAVEGKKVTLRKRGNKFIVVPLPQFNETRIPTPAQKNQQVKFSAASSYAKAAIANPELEKIYSKKANANRSTMNVALKDYMVAPRVKKIDTTGFKGKPGSTIRITAIDDCVVKDVKLSIYNTRGKLVEEGNAIPDPLFTAYWIYTATQKTRVLRGFKIKAVATDLANNTGELEITF